jgi:enoyl-CoA hydratase
LDDVVLLERRDHVLVVTINRPRARNAIDRAVALAIAAAMDMLDTEGELRAGVITGTPPGFSAGMDLKAFAAGETPWIEGRGFAGIAERGSRKPLIAAVEGFALAGGFEVALACDLIVAAQGAQFALPEVKRGLFAGGGGLLALPRRLPLNLASEMALTGAPFPAERLHELGLVNRLVATGSAVAVALELAAAIAANSPLGVRSSKALLRSGPSEEALREQAALWADVLAAPDAQEGATAFVAKRPPVWRTE